MFSSMLGLAGGVGSGGTSQTPGPSSSASSSASGDTSVGPIYGGGTNLGPDVTFNPVQLVDRVHLSGAGQVNEPVIGSLKGISMVWIACGLVAAALIFVAIRK